MPLARPFYDRDAVLSMKNYEYEDNEICVFAASNRVCNMYIVSNIIKKTKKTKRKKEEEEERRIGLALLCVLDKLRS